MKIKFAKSMFAATPALAGNVLKSPPYLKFYGDTDLISSYGNAIVPKGDTVFYAHPIEIDIPEYAHEVTDELFEITVTNNNEEAINRESFKRRGRVDEFLDNIEVSLRVVRPHEAPGYDPNAQANGTHPIAFPVANKIRNEVMKYALDTLRDPHGDTQQPQIQQSTPTYGSEGNYED